MDVHTPAQRHRNMAAIRGKNTKPEMVVRRVVHALGGRYRLHAKNLPGKPDLVFPVRKKVIFVHGCFWHMHDCRYGKVVPATRTEFWQNKRCSNVVRDRRHQDALAAQGWTTLVVWECETKNVESLRLHLAMFLDSRSKKTRA